MCVDWTGLSLAVGLFLVRVFADDLRVEPNPGGGASARASRGGCAVAPQRAPLSRRQAERV